jgi:hypothetical protein
MINKSILKDSVGKGVPSFRRVFVGLFATGIVALLIVASADAKPPPPTVTDWPVVSEGEGLAPTTQIGACQAQSRYAKWSGTAVSFIADTTCPIPVSVLAVTVRLYDRFQGQWSLIAEIPQWCLGFSYCSASGFESDLSSGLYK